MKALIIAGCVLAGSLITQAAEACEATGTHLDIAQKWCDVGGYTAVEVNLNTATKRLDATVSFAPLLQTLWDAGPQDFLNGFREGLASNGVAGVNMTITLRDEEGSIVAHCVVEGTRRSGCRHYNSTGQAGDAIVGDISESDVAEWDMSGIRRHCAEMFPHSVPGRNACEEQELDARRKLQQRGK